MSVQEITEIPFRAGSLALNFGLDNAVLAMVSGVLFLKLVLKTKIYNRNGCLVCAFPQEEKVGELLVTAILPGGLKAVPL